MDPVVSQPAVAGPTGEPPQASPPPGMEAVGAAGRSNRELLALVAMMLAVLLGAGGIAGLFLTRQRE